MSELPISELQSADWSYPTSIRFGSGRVNEIHLVCKELGIRHVLIISDENLVKNNALDEIIDALKNNELAFDLHTSVKPNPDEDDVTSAIEVYKRYACNGVVGVGGGSVLDVAKAVALLAYQSGDIWEYEDRDENWRKIDTEKIVPSVAIPTTAGTGSEVGRAAVFVSYKTQSKRLIFHPQMIPNVVIADPRMTVKMPPHLTAATGMDALVHALEAYCSPAYHPMADGIALQAMRMIKQWLPIAYEHADNIEARGHMLAAASMGAVAFQKGLGAVHALAHPLGAIYKKHHGLLNAILLPYVLHYNRSAITEKISYLCRVLELETTDFDGFMHWSMGLRETLMIPETLAEIGIDMSQASLIGKLASEDPSASSNPVLLTADEYVSLFQYAVKGNIRR